MDGVDEMDKQKLYYHFQWKKKVNLAASSVHFNF